KLIRTQRSTTVKATTTMASKSSLETPPLSLTSLTADQDRFKQFQEEILNDMNNFTKLIQSKFENFNREMSNISVNRGTKGKGKKVKK
ncbi:hypothetical protein WICMUC_005834, partial [Wickerhamomyces mucosus]